MIENPADLGTIRIALLYVVEYSANPHSKESARELLVRVEKLLARWTKTPMKSAKKVAADSVAANQGDSDR